MWRQRAGEQPGQLAGRSFQLDLRRLRVTELVAGVACLVACFALFTPWFGLPDVSFTGMSVHGYLVIPLLAGLGVTGLLVLRAGWAQLPFGLNAVRVPLLLAGTSLQLLFILIAFLIQPVGLAWQLGAYVALAAAFVAWVAIAVPAKWSG